MADLTSWVAIIIGFAGLIVGVFTLSHQLKQSIKSQKYLSEIIENQSKQIKILKKQVSRLSKGLPDKILLEKERIELKRREQENKEKWKQYNAFIKTVKFLTNLNKK